MKNKYNIQIILKRSSLVTFAVLIFSFVAVQAINAQSFILDVEHNPMTFENANRTVLNDPGSNGGLDQG